ncbi:MAG: hypothetical protein KAR38_14785 [Calditrichia bacterium]|nr:hypothetical protein [Calditrichia bacterium]
MAEVLIPIFPKGLLRSFTVPQGMPTADVKVFIGKALNSYHLTEDSKDKRKKKKDKKVYGLRLTVDS